jgi:hypothetical protein
MAGPGGGREVIVQAGDEFGYFWFSELGLELV